MARALEARSDYDQLRSDHEVAWNDLTDARSAFKEERYSVALSRARSALRELEDLLDPDRARTGRRSRFLSVQGGVEYRRGESGALGQSSRQRHAERRRLGQDVRQWHRRGSFSKRLDLRPSLQHSGPPRLGHRQLAGR